MTRREFFKRTAADAAMAAVVAAAGSRLLEASPFGWPIGSQTYPHRQMISDGDFAGLLKTLREIGVERVELCSPFGYKEFAPLADPDRKSTRLNSSHGYISYAVFCLKKKKKKESKHVL